MNHINAVINTALCHCNSSGSLYEFARNEMVNDGFHAADCVQEILDEEKLLMPNDVYEKTQLKNLIRFMVTAPRGVFLGTANVAENGRYIE